MALMTTNEQGGGTTGTGDGWKKDIEVLFTRISDRLEVEGQLKHQLHTQVKEIDQIVRKTLAVLQQTHGKIHEVGELCQKARKLIEQARPFYKNLQELIPAGLLHKYHDMWKFSLSQLVFASGLIVWFEEERLVTLQEASQLILGSSSTALTPAVNNNDEMMTEEGGTTGGGGGGGMVDEETLRIELEDYLTGLSYLPSEMARFCVNSAIAKDYERPKRIANFVSELFAGFRLLNLKNDNLRKRYDSIKYDLKKIEEVVYDISIRGLSSTSSSPSSSSSSSTSTAPGAPSSTPSSSTSS